MRFEVNGQEYFLAFVEEEKKYFVFAPTTQGLQRMPVYVDAAKYDRGSTAAATTKFQG